MFLAMKGFTKDDLIRKALSLKKTVLERKLYNSKISLTGIETVS